MLLDDLSKSEVPPPPDQFSRQLHERLNRTLVVMHFVDLILRGIPWATIKFMRPALALLKYTVSGRFEDQSRRH